MKIKQSESLKNLARKAKKNPETLSYQIFEEMVKANLLDTTIEYWGLTVGECIRGKSVVYFMDILRKIELFPSSKNVELLKSLVIMLDGDCPECGSAMELDPDQTIYETIYGDGINEPTVEREPTVEYCKCTFCDYTEQVK